VELSVIAVVIPTATGNRVVSVPAGAVLIQGAQGNPLMAEEYNHDAGRHSQPGCQRRPDGGTGQSRRDPQSPHQPDLHRLGVLFSASTTTNPPPNILGAVLEGGFDALHGQVSDRQQQEIEAILSRPNVWYIPAGQPVQVFTGNSFEVAL
jgi:hypothetical protein